MTSSRPYLVRALLDWILDNDMTPHVLVDANVKGVQVPKKLVNEDGQIVLNISPTAVRDYKQDNVSMTFTARFSGVEEGIFLPTDSIMGIYSRETGQGMVFEADVVEAQDSDYSVQPVPSPSGSTRPAGPPSLKVVK